MRFYANQPSLKDAIDNAACARRPDGKRHSHQTRIPSTSLAAARDRLLNLDVGECKSFAALFDLVERAIGSVHRIGELAIYDTALRLGAYLELQPCHIYLHRGARLGASRLGLDASRRFLDRSGLPAGFNSLQPHEIEDCLCIYKDVFLAAGGRPTRHCS